jgi:hypothetical protein
MQRRRGMPVDASQAMIDGFVKALFGYGLLLIVATLAVALILGNGAMLVRRGRRETHPRTFSRGREAVRASHFA